MQNLIDNHERFKTIQDISLGADFEMEKPYKVPIKLRDWCDNLACHRNRSQDNNQKLTIIIDSHIKFERIHLFCDRNVYIERSLIFYSALEHI